MKWKERVALTLAAAAILLTCILVLDVRFAAQQQQHPLAEEAGHAPLRHGTSRQRNGRKFQQQFLDSNATSAALGGQAPADNDGEPNEQQHQQPGGNQGNNNEEDPAAQQARYVIYDSLVLELSFSFKCGRRGWQEVNNQAQKKISFLLLLSQTGGLIAIAGIAPLCSLTSGK